MYVNVGYARDEGEIPQMRKRVLASLLAGLLLLTGCELISLNRDKDKAQVVATIGSVIITKGELYDAVQADFKAQGYDIDPWDEDMDETTRAQVDSYMKAFLDEYVNNRLVSIIGEKDYPLTDEEKKEITEQVDSYIGYIKLMLGYDAANPGAYTGDIEKDVDSYLTTMGTTREKMAQIQRDTILFSKVKDALMKDVAATEEQVQARYNTDLQAQKSAYATQGRTAYETAITSDSTSGTLGDYTLYKPTAYAVVKQILLSFSDADAEAYDDAKTAISDAQTDYNDVMTKYNAAKTAIETANKAIADAQAALTAAQQNNDSALVAQHQKTIADNNAIVAAQTTQLNAQAKLLVTLNTELKKANDRFTALQKRLLKGKQATVNTIMKRLQNGETFEALMEEYSKEDGGADSGAMPGLGYVVSPDNTTYEAAFASAALAMTARGQISAPVMTPYGVHILSMGYTPQEEADVPYETCKAAVKAKEDATVIAAAWKIKIEELRKQYSVQTWPTRTVYLHERINK